ncbi:MAG TPA: hypothetical protein VMX33_15120 [bacterium]|nr:hypothetical protein [bacterium]
MTNNEQTETIEGRLVAYVASLRQRFEALKMQFDDSAATGAGLPAIDLYALDERRLRKLEADAYALAYEAADLARLVREVNSDRDAAR